jgi:tRNA-Thr(GGU) m(6)t(6)A37 methyltransferase TsaA
VEQGIYIRPIGYVKNDFKKGPINDYENTISEIVLDPDLEEGLYKLDENSHITVVFWMNKIKEGERNILKMHPKGREDLPLVGVFATRSPRRPNPMGISSIRLLEIRDNVLRVKGLDALNGTPVLDIKPFSKKHDHAEDAKTPWWIERFSKKKLDERCS